MEEYDFTLDVPEKIRGKYDIVTCLKYTEERSVYLLKSISDGAYVLLKCGNGKSGCLLENEYRIVRRLLKEKDCGFILKPIDFFTENDRSYYLREYVKGSTLEMIVETGSVFGEKEAASIISVLCGIVEKLHKLNPPIICRDLNPSNILIADDGSIKIIDFDSAKQYDENADHDAMCIGTKEMAAPEQFGFAQSDCRTDVYVLGMLLLYISTGSYDRNGVMPKRLKAIINRSIEFNPKDRYQSVGKMCGALRQCINNKVFKAVAFSAAALAFVAIAVFVAPHFFRREAVFVSPVIEQEVRRQLGISENEKIYLDEAAKIDHLLLSGDRVLDSWDELENLHTYLFDQYAEMDVPEEPKLPLDDIGLLTGLKYLALDKQGVSELPDDLPNGLVALSVCDNKLSDISSVTGCHELEYLWISSNYEINDISCLEELDRLKSVDAACCVALSDISSLREKPLEKLCINFTEVYDVPFVDEFLQLEHLIAGNVTAPTLEKIGSLTGLKELELCGCDALTEFSVISRLTALEGLILDTPNLCDMDGISNMQLLDTAGFNNARIKALPAEIAQTNITTLTLLGCGTEDFTALKNCKSFVNLRVDEDSYIYASEQLSGSTIVVS
ncbi:MAG: protein kinase [Oscillospiraceae bacterium]|nr:protein kinase [Oscillospiraceae bacterium]